MTEDITALTTELLELRDNLSAHEVAALDRAADALEAQAKRITELEAETVDLRKWWARSVRAIQKREAERDSLAAQIAEALAVLDADDTARRGGGAGPSQRSTLDALWRVLDGPALESLDRVRAEALRAYATELDGIYPVELWPEVTDDQLAQLHEFARSIGLPDGSRFHVGGIRHARNLMRAEADRIEHTPNDEHPTDRSE